ncbi:MAG: YraN family protein [Armatimonadota bacterium]|nr:YraN family protein [bacterium]MDW8321166.1 YraN family protein [Armatimonadota bacterium]
MDNHETARAGEQIAARYLTRKGCTILQQNWRCPYGEVDIVAQDGDTILFVEVKARHNVEHTLPREAVDERKQARLRQCAELYLNLFYPEAPCRFDVVEVWWQSGRAYVRWLREAF